MERSLIILLLTIGVSRAAVEFTHSTLYDIRSFTGVAKVRLPQCDNGCLIFASTLGLNFGQNPDGQDPYARNLVIHNEVDDVQQSITALATMRDNKRRKTPMRFEGPARVSVLNSNGPEDTFFDIVLYVVDLQTASKLTYSVYDALYLADGPIAVDAPGVVTVMGAYAFTLDAPTKATPSSLSLRLAGFDNAGDANTDQCPHAYKSPAGDSFGGFSLRTSAPIASFDVAAANGLQLRVAIANAPVLKLTEAGFISTSGYNGCLKPANGGVQAFRSQNSIPSGVFTWNSAERYNMRLEVVPHLDAKHAISIIDQSNPVERLISGTAEVDITMENVSYFTILFSGMGGDQGFLVRTMGEPVEQRTSSLAPTTPGNGGTTSSLSSQPTTSAYTEVTITGAALLLSLFALP